MTTEINLKSKNAIPLWSFFTFNIIVFVVIFLSINLDAILSNYKALITFRTSGVLMAPVILFVVMGLLSSSQKASLVFWRFKDVLPGCRAFSVLAPKDSRINLQRLTSINGELPIRPREQNQLWYKLFKKHSTNVIVVKSHRDFLLARDMTAICFLFFILSGLPMLYFGRSPYNYIYLFFLFIQYLILVVVAQNHGRRFVTNVLALESIE